MRFQLSVAFKYLIPRWRQLSVSIISLISVLVISLVVWLVVVFLSVTDGIEKKWIDQLVALNAPLKIVPTEAYYNSYYYQVDSLSAESDFTTKTIGEKLQASSSDPYDPLVDFELPPEMPPPEFNPDGSIKDLTKEAWAVVSQFSGARAQEYEVTFGNLHLELVRDEPSFLTQVSYIASHDHQNHRMRDLILSPTQDDLDNFQKQAGDSSVPLWVDRSKGLPQTNTLGDGILVSKSFQSNGVLLGDRGYLSYYTPTPSAIQEQRVPVYVAGFYDPGFMPVGNKVIFATQELISQMRGSVTVADQMLGNGINIHLAKVGETENVKQAIQQIFDKQGLSKYWSVLSYADYEFARPVLQQLQSDKHLFTLIAVIILIVACSNIISMLILLVNDKKKEIGIMQSMGASATKIASIFGICGFVTGLLSSVIGTIAAVLTLHHLQSLINLLSFLQGHEAFQAAFYGSALPNELSMEALTFVLSSTIVISLLAGIAPAIKAACVRPSEILRSE